ncbi:FkbM family methyltransferase [Quadrisphaera sp. INWT6]|uniref:FkbM family methyltransferase n=1 Tax=Quadrisphaera sp. INWT6 TaxID=2596917 RepID=UPI001891F561|nr:FkbM family methyltransferase [Quadrisphaera sp. INWT6]MBF5083142.1 FkbM family methyltransferase [Quadrisphaera sp. INWT6]
MVPATGFLPVVTDRSSALTERLISGVTRPDPSALLIGVSQSQRTCGLLGWRLGTVEGENVMQGTYIGQGRMLITPVYGGFLFAPASDLSITPTLVVHGAMEPPLTQYLWRALDQDSVFVDVGANIGYFSVLAAHKLGSGGRLIAVEANPDAMRFVRDSLAANWLTDRDITLVEAAASDVSGTVSFHRSERFVGDSSVHASASGIVERGVQTVSVPAVALDEVLADVERVDVLKMDIEGGEHLALLGLERTIDRGAIRTLVMEWNPRMLGDRDAAALAALMREWRSRRSTTTLLLDEEGDPVVVDLDDVLALPSHPYVVVQFP